MIVIEGRLRNVPGGAVASPTVARPIIQSVNSGRDAWGRSFIYAIVQRHSLLISTGSDGRLDVAEISEYLKLRDEVINGRPAHDIVILDGVPITRVGK